MRHKALFRWNIISLAAALGMTLYYRLAEMTVDARAVTPELSEEGALCVGLYSRSGTMYTTRTFCPDGYAIMGNRNYSAGPLVSNCNSEESAASGLTKEQCLARAIQVEPVCCPLPGDAFDRTVSARMVPSRCEEGFVATGAAPVGSCTNDCDMQCSKLNTDRYTLGPAKKSLTWSKRAARVALSGGTSGRGNSDLVLWEELPLSIRFALGRASYNLWDNDGCVGSPIGSLLVEKKGPSCGDFLYSELQYKDGRPVPLLRRCSAVRGLYSDTPECLP